MTVVATVSAGDGNVLLAALRLSVFVFDTALFIALVLFASIHDPTGRRAYRVARWWAWVNVRICGVRVDVDGLAHLDPTRSYVFMSNHRSAFDVLTLMVALWPFQLRWVAKAELGRIPGFGWGLRATKQIFVDRRDHAQALASLDAARNRIRGGISAVFFPEGTRSPGTMLPFKKGGFVFAIQTGTPIVPIAIDGAGSLVQRNSLLRRRGANVRVVVRPPVPTAGLSLRDRDALLLRVRWMIASAAKQGRSAPSRAPHRTPVLTAHRIARSSLRR
jgi:1-acyl-sn-glycerol-3-phosphate acyltransferase